MMIDPPSPAVTHEVDMAAPSAERPGRRRSRWQRRRADSGGRHSGAGELRLRGRLPSSSTLSLAASVALALTAAASIRIPVVKGDGLDELMDKMSSDALRLASEFERAHSMRCSDETLRECPGGSHDSCMSEYPSQSCPGGDVFAIPECGDGVECGGMFDMTVSSVRIPLSVRGGLSADGNPLDDVVKETICYSLQSERYMVEKFENESSYWSTNYGGDSPSTFFGSDESAFRIHPARQSAECGRYDNTRRPWYVAATSGPKDVVLILDTSGSMTRRGRLDLMKTAARRVVETLTVGDHVAAISFDTEASPLVGTRMVQATDENKATLLDAIDGLTAGGSTNFMAAFDAAFDVIGASRLDEFTSDCHTAILFLTDGKMTLPTTATAEDVVRLVETRSNETGVDPRIFLYSLGLEANRGDGSDVPRRIACSTGGMWSRVDDGGDLASAMASYYRLFALGLGDGDNEGFVAWVDPYRFATGGVMGTTVSAPVYDRSVTPSVLVGAVGIDFTMAAMDKALGVDAGSRETLKRLVARSTAMCPKLELTECVVQSLRLDAGGEEALCPEECTNFVGIRPTACGTEDDYPANFWANTENEGRSYGERVCCSVGETRTGGELSVEEVREHQCVVSAASASPGGQQKASAGGGASLAPVVGGVLVVLALAAAGGWYFFVRKRRQTKSASNPVASGGGDTDAGNVGNGDETTDGGKESLRDLPPVIAPVAVPVPVPVATDGNYGYSSNAAWDGGGGVGVDGGGDGRGGDYY